MSVASRLHPDFKIVLTSQADSAQLVLSGPLETRDQLDAVVEALGVMREWLAVPDAAGEQLDGVEP